MEKEIINKLRLYYDLPESITDKEIESDLHGSLGHASIKLNAAVLELKSQLIKQLPKWIKNLLS